MDDALHLALGLGPDRDDVAPRPDGDDRLADDPRHGGRPQHGVQPLANPVLRGSQAFPDGGQLRRRRVEQLAADVDAAADALGQLRSGVELVAQGGEVRLAPGPQPRLESGRRFESVGDLDQLGRREPPAAPGSLERDANVARTADAGLCLVVEQPRGLIGLVLEQGHV